jgi:hypothetical protein
MGGNSFILKHAILGTIVGGLLAISTIIFFFPIVAAIWLAVLFELLKSCSVGQRLRRGMAMFGVQATAIFVVLLVARFAPVKTEDRLLKRPVVLPKTEMTLRDLTLLEARGAAKVPALSPSAFAERDSDLVVHWPGKEMTLQEFIATIESQTPLRHRFGSCGNGATVLWGGDCVFGLTFRVPKTPP